MKTIELGSHMDALLRYRRGLVQWLYPLQRQDGVWFAPRSLFVVLRQDGRKVNLCEIRTDTPSGWGDTIVQVDC